MKKRLAIIGVRGIPVVYSGFETCAEEIATRLIPLGWDTTVYCRTHAMLDSATSYRGVSRVILPSLNLKSFDTLTHSLLATLHVLFSVHKADVVLYLGVGSSIFSFIPRLRGIRTVVNVDGLDWKREKWGVAGRLFLRISEKLALSLPDRALTDSRFVQDYYAKTYGGNLPIIPYGFRPGKPSKKMLKKYGLQPGTYFVWTGRLVPDNHVDELVEAYAAEPHGAPLVLVGGGDENDPYIRKLAARIRSLNIRMTGFVGREDYAAIVSQSLAYIETKRSGGTHPSLLESMGYGCLIVCNDHPAHKDVLGETAFYYSPGAMGELQSILGSVETHPHSHHNEMLRKKTALRVRQKFTWKAVASDYDALLTDLLNRSNHKLTEVEGVRR